MQPEPSPQLQNHLIRLSSLWTKRDGFYFQELMTTLINKNIPALQEDIKNLRKSTLCMYCDWHNQNFINSENFTVLYKNSFCMSLVDNHIDTLYEKYGVIVQTLLVLDEWIYLTTGTRFFDDPKSRALYRRYALIVEQCNEDKNIENCAPLCREFNLNQFSFMFDGESEPFEKYVLNFKKFFEIFKDDQKKIYNTYQGEMANSEFEEFKEDHSVFSTKLFKDPLNSSNENSFGLKFSDNGKLSIYEKKHEVEDVQIKTLDTELDSFVIFETMEEPVDVASYLIFFDQY